MSYDDYQRLRIAVADGICRATIDSPPINLLDLSLILELGRFAAEVAADDDVTVVMSIRPTQSSSSPTPTSR